MSQVNAFKSDPMFEVMMEVCLNGTKKEEVVLMNAPSVHTLNKIRMRLRELIGYNYDIVFSGSAVLNLYGLINRKIKDIDVVIVIGVKEDKDEAEAAEREILDVCLSDANGEQGRHAGPASGLERLVTLNLEGYNVELFIEQRREHLDLATRSGDLIHVSKIDDIFKKKYDYDIIKTDTDLELIKQYLTSQNQTQKEEF